MVIQSILLRISLPLLGKGRGGGHGHTEPSSEKFSSSGKGEEWWPWSHTTFFSKALFLFWEKGKWWWSWSYKAFFSKALFLFWERERGLVIRRLLLKSSPSHLGKGKGWITTPIFLIITIPILKSSLPLLGKGKGGSHGHTQREGGMVAKKKVVYGHDTTPSLSQKRKRASKNEVVYDHDHHHFPFTKWGGG